MIQNKLETKSKIDKYIYDFNRERRFHRCLHSFKIFLISPLGIIITIVAILIVVISLIYTSNCIKIIDFFTFLVFFYSAIFGFDYLKHSQNRIMMEFLEDIKKQWDSREILLARKCILEKVEGDETIKELKDYVDFKLNSLNIEYSICHINKDESAEACVCNFFEELGYFLERRVVDIDFIYEMYGDAVTGYYDVLKMFIKKEQGLNTNNYSKFCDLEKAVKECKKVTYDR